MADVIPTKKSASGRKQWTFHEGSRGSLKRLRNQLANDGCPESQVVLAKQLLENQCVSERNSESNENARLGVYWLIKASEQGNIEATELLKNCLKTGKGVTEHNYLDVKSCITMAQDEKLAKKAAREMFSSLSNGGDYITSIQLQKHMLAINRKEKHVKKTIDFNFECGESSNGKLINNYEEIDNELEQEAIDWSERLDSGDEKLTEDHLVSAAVNYSHGQLPVVNKILCLTDPNLHALDHIPYIQRSILHPILMLKILYYKLIKLLGRQNFFKYFSIAKTDIQLLFLMFLYSLISTENILLFLPMILYYVTFIIMIVTTFQMLQAKRDFLDFRIWSGLFICYSDGSMNAEEAEYHFICNNLKPYGHFFVALLLNLIVYPLIVEQWIPQSELTIISFCLTFMTLLGFMPKQRNKTALDAMLLFSFAVNVLAKYPYETDPVVTQGWRFLELKVPTFASYIIGNGIEFCINFRVLFYIFIPFIFIKIAARHKWRGTYKLLIPHCVTLSWLQIVIISSQGATMFGLIRGTLALVGIVLFLPLVGLTTVILPAAALTKWIISSNTLYSFIVFAGLICLGVGICWLLVKNHYSKLATSVQIIFILIAVYIFITSTPLQEKKNLYEDKELSWDIFQKFCVEPTWNGADIALTQIKCSNLDKMRINWNGYVKNVKITSISNTWKRVFDMFPDIISKRLYCTYGDKIKHECDNVSEFIKEDCGIFYDIMKSWSECTLDKWNVYEMQIVVRMDSSMWSKSTETLLIVDNYFKNFTLHLKTGDHIWFKGQLLNIDNKDNNEDGNYLRPQIHLREIGCLSCDNVKLTEEKLNMEKGLLLKTIMSNLYLGIKCVLNFLLGPVVVFK